MVIIWLLYGYYMVIIWLLYGYYMVIICLLYGYYMVIIWLYCQAGDITTMMQFQGLFSGPRRKFERSLGPTSRLERRGWASLGTPGKWLAPFGLSGWKAEKMGKCHHEKCWSIKGYHFEPTDLDIRRVWPLVIKHGNGSSSIYRCFSYQNPTWYWILFPLPRVIARG